MRATENKQLIQLYIDTLTGKNTEHSLEDFFSESATWDSTNSARMITAKTRTGRSQVIASIKEILRQFVKNSINVVIHKLIADDHDVAVQFTLSGLMLNGRHHESQQCFVYSIENGQIATVREYSKSSYLWQPYNSPMSFQSASKNTCEPVVKQFRGMNR